MAIGRIRNSEYLRLPLFTSSIQKWDDVEKPWNYPEIASPFHPCSIRNKPYEIAYSSGTAGLDVAVFVADAPRAPQVK